MGFPDYLTTLHLHSWLVNKCFHCHCLSIETGHICHPFLFCIGNYKGNICKYVPINIISKQFDCTFLTIPTFSITQMVTRSKFNVCVICGLALFFFHMQKSRVPRYHISIITFQFCQRYTFTTIHI